VDVSVSKEGIEDVVQNRRHDDDDERVEVVDHVVGNTV